MSNILSREEHSRIVQRGEEGTSRADPHCAPRTGKGRIGLDSTKGKTAPRKADCNSVRDQRKSTDPKSVTFEGAHGALELKQFSESLILIRLSGSDTGELRDAPMRTLDEWLDQAEAVELFIDVRKVKGASNRREQRVGHMAYRTSRPIHVDHDAHRQQVHPDYGRGCAAVRRAERHYVGPYRCKCVRLGTRSGTETLSQGPSPRASLLNRFAFADAVTIYCDNSGNKNPPRAS